MLMSHQVSDLTLQQELGLMPVDEEDSPAKAGLVMFCAFICFGLVPLLCKYGSLLL